MVTATLLTRSAEFASLSIEGGYNNSYVVNGVEVASEVPHFSFGAVKTFKHLDTYVGGTSVANGGADQSHWLVGVGKSFYPWKSGEYVLRGDVVVQRHQTASVGIDNSTEFGTKLAFQNPWLTLYVRGSFNVELDQTGYFFGAERVQELPLGFFVTPSVEWGRVTDYDALVVKAELIRPFAFHWGNMVPFVGVGWYDNPTWNEGITRFALRRFENDVVYSAGVRFTF